MKNFLRTAVVLSIAVLAGCSDPPAAPETAAAPAETAAPGQIAKENQGILTDAQREGLNTANQVSGLLEDAEAKRREQMEAQGL